MSSADNAIRPLHHKRSSSRTKSGKQSTRVRDRDERIKLRQRAERHKLKPPHTKDLSGVSAFTNFIKPHPAINSSSLCKPTKTQTYQKEKTHPSSENIRHAKRLETLKRDEHRDPRPASRTKTPVSPIKSRHRRELSGRRVLGPRSNSSDDLNDQNFSPSMTTTPFPSPSRRTVSENTPATEVSADVNSQFSHKKNLSATSSILSSALSAAYNDFPVPPDTHTPPFTSQGVSSVSNLSPTAAHSIQRQPSTSSSDADTERAPASTSSSSKSVISVVPLKRQERLEPRMDGNALSEQTRLNVLPVVWTGGFEVRGLHYRIDRGLDARQIGGKPIPVDSPDWENLLPPGRLLVSTRRPVEDSAKSLLQSAQNPHRQLVAVSFSPRQGSGSLSIFKLLLNGFAKIDSHWIVPLRRSKSSPAQYRAHELVVIPLLSKDPIPDYLSELQGLSLPQVRQANYIIGVWVLEKKDSSPAPSTATSTTVTPRPSATKPLRSKSKRSPSRRSTDSKSGAQTAPTLKHKRVTSVETAVTGGPVNEHGHSPTVAGRVAAAPTYAHATEGLATSPQPIASSSKRKVNNEPAEASTRTQNLSHSQEANLLPRNHPEFWIDNASVILQIEATRYKLPQYHLSKHSTFFADLLREENVEATEQPVYYLRDIKARDFEALLHVMDDAIIYANVTPSFHVMASVLKASSALQFPAFRDFAIRYFGNEWSSNLEQLTSEPLPHAPEMLVLARKYDLPDLTKRALYEVVRMPDFGVGIETKDSKAKTPNPDLSEEDKLTRDELRLLIKARVILTEVWRYATDHHHSCGPDNKPCEKVPHGALSTAVFESGLFHQYQYDPIRGLAELRRHRWELLPDECRSAQRMFWKTTRLVLWKDLETWFEL